MNKNLVDNFIDITFRYSQDGRTLEKIRIPSIDKNWLLLDALINSTRVNSVYTKVNGVRYFSEESNGTFKWIPEKYDIIYEPDKRLKRLY